MDEIFSNKYLLLVIGVFIFIGSFVIGLSVLSYEENDDIVKEYRTYHYTMYVKSDEIVKFDFDASFLECRDSNNKRYACGNYKDSITDYKLFNTEESLFSSVDFNEKTIIDTLSSIVDLATKNNPELKQITIVTNYEFDYKEISDEIKKKLNLSNDFKIIGITRKELIEESIINELNDNKKVNVYTVSFNTDNGSLVNDQEIVENEMLITPITPTKDGFIFVEWQLDGVKFNFNTPITSDLVLTALWKELKEVSYDSTPTTTTTTTQAARQEDKPTTTTTTTKSAQSKNLSTFNKINLNDNITVYTEEASSCGYYYFSKGLDDNGNIIYDEDKENSVKTELDNIKNNGYKSFKYFNYSFEDHKLIISYTVLQLSNKYSQSTLYNNWKKNISKVTDIWADATYTGAGMCGTTQSKATQLTEGLCNEFNLTCARW